jgi:hypothetical protein
MASDAERLLNIIAVEVLASRWMGATDTVAFYPRTGYTLVRSRVIVNRLSFAQFQTLMISRVETMR